MSPIIQFLSFREFQDEFLKLLKRQFGMWLVIFINITNMQKVLD